jgi:NAD(P)-dependent dehydrogenase (short-subunit alcohol dehydrogenase family)
MVASRSPSTNQNEDAAKQTLAEVRQRGCDGVPVQADVTRPEQITRMLGKVKMGKGGRILAITYAEGSRTGGLQPWVGMGSAKAALESLVRYFAVTLARREITVNAISPYVTFIIGTNVDPRRSIPSTQRIAFEDPKHG